MVAPVFHGSVSDAGALELEPGEGAIRRAYLRRLAGKRVDVVVRVHRSQRSLDQNAWLWGVAIPILADALGYDRHEHERLHYALVDTCFGVTEDARLGGRPVPNVRSSQLSTAEFSRYMEWLVRWAAEQGIIVPLPGEAV